MDDDRKAKKLTKSERMTTVYDLIRSQNGPPLRLARLPSDSDASHLDEAQVLSILQRTREPHCGRGPIVEYFRTTSTSSRRIVTSRQKQSYSERTLITHGHPSKA